MLVLVADSLGYFLRRERVPAGWQVELFAPGAIPGGAAAGLVPDITRRVRREDLARLPGLRIVANYGVGYDNIDVAAARERGIVVTNTPGVLTGATAELTWALILATLRRTGEGERLVRASRWTGWQATQLLGTSLAGKTLGVVGAGRIGSAVARRAPAFDMSVVYSSRSRNAQLEADVGARHLPLPELLQSVDVISLHTPISVETTHLIGARELRSMKRTAYLINTARGPIVDESALIRALEEGWLRGAGLDVYEREPAISAALLGREDVVLLPHLGSATEETRQAMWDLAWRNLRAGLSGEAVPNPVS